MFEPTLDSEQVFGHDRPMGRTRVRRRRRLAAATLGVAIGLVVGAPVAGALGRHAAQATGGVRPVRSSEHVYVVRSGDTVWSIAERVAGGGDPRPVVDAIAARNDVDAGAVVPGQSLVIPDFA